MGSWRPAHRGQWLVWTMLWARTDLRDFYDVVIRTPVVHLDLSIWCCHLITMVVRALLNTRPAIKPLSPLTTFQSFGFVPKNEGANARDPPKSSALTPSDASPVDPGWTSAATMSPALTGQFPLKQRESPLIIRCCYSIPDAIERQYINQPGGRRHPLEAALYIQRRGSP